MPKKSHRATRSAARPRFRSTKSRTSKGTLARISPDASSHTVRILAEIDRPKGKYFVGSTTDVVVELDVAGRMDGPAIQCCTLKLYLRDSLEPDGTAEVEFQDITPLELFALQRLINAAIGTAQERGDLMLDAHGGH